MKRLFDGLKRDVGSKDFWYSVQGSITIASIILAIWVAWLIVVPRLYPAARLDPGTSGDMFGGLTALFSGLAFAGLVSTLLMQSRELQLQREELAQTRDVFSIQRFENTLFGLLRLLNDHVATFEHRTRRRVGTKFEDGPVIIGRSAVKNFANMLPHPTHLQEVRSEETGEVLHKSVEIPVENLIAMYEQLYSERLEPDFAPYFRLLYNIFRLIDNAKFSDAHDLNEMTKRDYARIVRAHLSSSEVMFLMFNGLSSAGQAFRHWTEKFTLLKHLPDRHKDTYRSLLSEYKPRAYQEEE